MKKQSLIIGASLLGVAATASIAFAEVNQPQEIVMRPLTTPAGQITVGGDLGIILIPDVDTLMPLLVSGKYGVDDKIEVGALYGIALSPEFEAKGPLFVEGAYNIMEGNLSVAANLGFGYSVGGEELLPITAGARVRFRLNDQLAITSGAGGGDPISSFIIPGYLNGSQLSITVAGEEGEPKPITLGLPVGVAYQASPALYAFANTAVANISISDSETAVFGADFIPLSVGAFFSPSNTMDFGASVSWFDLKEFSDVININLAARLHM